MGGRGWPKRECSQWLVPQLPLRLLLSRCPQSICPAMTGLTHKSSTKVKTTHGTKKVKNVDSAKHRHVLLLVEAFAVLFD